MAEALLPIMFAAGTGLQAFGQLKSGQEAARAAGFEKQQYDINAQQTRVAADQAETKRRDDLNSNLQTIAALRASRGVGETSPTGVTTTDHFIDLSERDAFAERTSLLTKADNYSMASTMAGYKEKYSLLAGDIGAATTLLKSPFDYAKATSYTPRYG